jgi:hypothetical protein
MRAAALRNEKACFYSVEEAQLPIVTLGAASILTHNSVHARRSPAEG